MTLILGSDPEFFLKDSQGKTISSIKKLRGTKRKPRRTKHGFIQEDNVLAEVNTNIATTKEEFINNHLLIIQDLNEIIEPLDLSVDISPVNLMPDSELQSPHAWIAGCDEDLCAWTKRANPQPEYKTNLRVAGGHVHINYPDATSEKSIEFCKALDSDIGLKSVILDKDGSARRELYGKAGAMRLKNSIEHAYNGFEYRVLSNFWCKSTELIGLVYDSISNTYNDLENRIAKANQYSKEIQEAINTSNPELANELLEELCY